MTNHLEIIREELSNDQWIIQRENDYLGIAQKSTNKDKPIINAHGTISRNRDEAFLDGVLAGIQAERASKRNV